MNNVSRIWAPLALIAAAALTACGGGGSNGGAPVTPSSTGPLAINEGNYQQVINNTGVSAMSATEPAGASTLVNTTSQANKLMPSVSMAVATSIEQMQGDRSLIGVQVSVCSTGSLDVAYTDTNNNKIWDAGDVVVANFASCVVPDAGSSTVSKFNGKMTITLKQVTGTAGQACGLNFDSFKIESTGFAGTVNGSMLYVLTRTLNMIDAPTLRLDVVVAGKTQTDSWTNFQYSAESLDGTNFDSGASVKFSGQLESSSLGNKSVELTTPVALEFVGTADSPNAGKIVVKGAAGSNASATVNNELSVTLAVDANGDGVSEQSKSVTWSEFLGSNPL